MKIDPKYFNVFLLIVALIAATLIAFFTITNRSSERTAFSERMFANDSLQTIFWQKVGEEDSLEISEFDHSFVVVNFWANWSDASLELHQELSNLKSEHTDKLQVIAASVGLRRSEVQRYISDHNFPFHFVDGSQQFSNLRVPGLPTQLIYTPKGQLHSIFLGYPDNSQYDSLRALITDGDIR